MLPSWDDLPWDTSKYYSDPVWPDYDFWLLDYLSNATIFRNAISRHHFPNSTSRVKRFLKIIFVVTSVILLILGVVCIKVFLFPRRVPYWGRPSNVSNVYQWKQRLDIRLFFLENSFRQWPEKVDMVENIFRPKLIFNEMIFSTKERCHNRYKNFKAFGVYFTELFT